MRDEVIFKLYANEHYLDYLRRHPKWYYYLDLDPKYFSEFERVVKKSLKMTTYDRLEALKNQVNFAGAMIKYLASQ
ncbi:MAG TPA: YlbE-like family protein [Bacilli bacterium]